MSGWWGLIRSDDLLARNDNPRRWINDFYVSRGSILDRNNNPIVVTVGESGSFRRNVLYPPLSLVIGYSDYIYGQSGLEESLDPYLRGLQGSPSSQILMNQLLYNQTPEGLNVRLSIDQNLQEMTDEMLGGYKGAAILLNAKTDEILALASHPFFDSNELTTRWEEYSQDSNSPLLNRVTQGQYPVGAALGPFLMANALSLNLEPPTPGDYQHMLLRDRYIKCALEPGENMSWAQALKYGCPRAFEALSDTITSYQFEILFNQLGFGHSPDIPLHVAEARSLNFTENDEIDLIDVETILVSPLQMAIAAAAFSNAGTCPSPHLAMAVLTSEQGWVILPGKNPTFCLQSSSSQKVAEMLSISSLPIWQFTSLGYSSQEIVTWYAGGTTPDWQGTPLTLVIVLQEESPAEAEDMGYNILKNALSPD
jgi:cell division protein FtsI/penicillin-binding protein 2